MNGRIATEGKFEYKFSTFGSVTVVFVDVKFGNPAGRMSAIPQVIAECDGQPNIELAIDI